MAIPSNPLSLTLEGVLLVIYFVHVIIVCMVFRRFVRGLVEPMPPCCCQLLPTGLPKPGFLGLPANAGFLGPAARNCARVEPIYA